MVGEQSKDAAKDSNVAALSDEATTTQSSMVKQPPPETAESIWTRTRIVLSFWAVILLLGLPMWWKTTSIYRAQLPFQEMLDWDQGTVGLTLTRMLAAWSDIAMDRSVYPAFPLRSG